MQMNFQILTYPILSGVKSLLDLKENAKRTFLYVKTKKMSIKGIRKIIYQDKDGTSLNNHGWWLQKSLWSTYVSRWWRKIMGHITLHSTEHDDLIYPLYSKNGLWYYSDDTYTDYLTPHQPTRAYEYTHYYMAKLTGHLWTHTCPHGSSRGKGNVSASPTR
jgi:hypothetical protein